MTVARSVVVDAEEDGVYHAVSRCVRRAFLCGMDHEHKRCFDHRREWIEQRLETAADAFAIEVFAYSIMENHFHVVLKSKVSESSEWSDAEVVDRWLRLYPYARDGFGRPEAPNDVQMDALLADKVMVSEWRKRLSDVSWVMKFIKEWVAREANKEDDVTGHFWEGRFKCTRLKDDGATMTCMAYVDLNPVRAGIAATPEDSAFTSVKLRSDAQVAQRVAAEAPTKPTADQARELNKACKAIARADWLTPVEEISTDPEMGAWQVSCEDYLRFVDEAGRYGAEGKRGVIPNDLASILKRMDVDAERWVENVHHYGSLFHLVAGKLSALVESAKKAQRRWFCGREGCAKVYVVSG